MLTCIGDAGGFHYKKSRRGNAEIDRAVAHVLRHCGEPSEILDFSPYGYDERQYCSPGFNLPVGCLMRSVWGTFPEYHTSADNLDFIHPDSLLDRCVCVCPLLTCWRTTGAYLNQNPYCEPQLGKRNLYRGTGGESIDREINARLWVLNFSDGEHSLLDIAERSGLPFAAIHDAAELFAKNGLLAGDHRRRCQVSALDHRPTDKSCDRCSQHLTSMSYARYGADRSCMKVLLTGHKGYIGAVAGPMLRSAGHDVVGLDTDLYAGCDLWRTASRQFLKSAKISVI